jgi:cytochrome c oxidase subunit II
VPKQVHGNKRLEIGWTILPAVLLAGIAFPTVGTLISLSHKPAGNILELNVTAHQFWWEVNYPSLHVKSASEIHVPVNTPVYVSLRSIDVIHSFWIPRLAGKQDVVPNQVNHLTFEADRAGMYRAQCAEFCGLSHANMRFQVVAESQADFEAWVQQQQQPAAKAAPGSLEAQGQDIFEHGVWNGVLFTGETIPVHGCTQCHTVEGIPGGAKVGPNLTHFAGRAAFAGAIFPNNASRLALWLRDPEAVKPGVDMPNMGLSEQEIDALVAYLGSLK